MEFFLSLQPIFNKDKAVYGYQVYHKKKDEGSDMDVYKFTLDTIQTLGLERFTRGKPAFLTFTEYLIRREVPTIMAPNKVIVDVKRPEVIDEGLIQNFTDLKQQNYTLCFGQYVFKTYYRELLNFADIIKIDLSDVDAHKKQVVVDFCNRNNKHVLATKVDYNANFEYSKYLGCKFFEGLFFSRPEIVEVKDIAPFKFNYLQLIGSVNKPTVNFEEIADVISRDVSLSYKLLRLVNSVAFGFRSKIESIKHAAVVLGEKELRKWASFLALNGMVDNQPNEIVRISLFRAKFAELLAKKSDLKKKSNEIFMMGLFSMLDVIMGRPLEEVLEGLQLAENVEKALLKNDGQYVDLYSFVIAYEKCDWDEVDKKMELIGVSENVIIEEYLQANSWCNELLEETFSLI